MSGNGPPRSLFGGPLSTRQLCTNKEALRREQARLEAEAAGKAKKAAKKQHQQQQGAPTPSSRDPQKRQSLLVKESPESKKKRLYQEALNDFDDLLTDGPPKPRPRPPAPKPQPESQQPQQPQQKSKPLPHQLSTQQRRLPLQHSPYPPPHKAAKAASPARPSAPTTGKHQATLPIKRPVRRGEDEFDEEDRREMEAAGRSLGRDAADARRRVELKRRKGVTETDSEDDLDDFVVDDEEDEEPEWRREMRALTGYDPRKYQNERHDDRLMEAGYNDILAEERRSARVAREEDRRAEEEERKRLEAKAKAKHASAQNKKQKV